MKTSSLDQSTEYILWNPLNGDAEAQLSRGIHR